MASGAQDSMAPNPRRDCSTVLAKGAGCVQQRFDDHVEGMLLPLLAKWQKLSPRDQRRMGDPATIVLETELVASLSARLRAAPWQQVVTAANRDGSQIRGAESAMELLLVLFRLLHNCGAALRKDREPAQPSTPVLQALLRQARTSPCP